MPVDRRDTLRKFGAGVSRRRRALGLSQEGLAELTGLHRTYIGSVERGERNPTLTTIQSLASGLNCAPADLLGGSSNTLTDSDSNNRSKE